MGLVLLSTFVFLLQSQQPAQAQESIGYKTVSECARDLRTKMWWDDSSKKADKICKEHAQVHIDCAIELTKSKRLSYTFEKALTDCTRKRVND